MVGDARRIGPPASYEIPDGVDLRATTRAARPATRRREAALLVRKGAGPRCAGARPASRTTWPGPTPTAPGTGWSCRGDRLAEELLALGPDVLVESPAELREDIVARLRATVGR